MSEDKDIVPVNFERTSSLTKSEIREIIGKLEASMIQNPDQVEIPIKHHFSKDVYAREIFIPKGTCLVGKIHKFENLNILSQGELSLLSIDGVQRVKAPFTVVSSPGVKRFAFAHEDSVWTTIHGTSERDLEKIEETFIAKTYSEVPKIEDKAEVLCLG